MAEREGLFIICIGAPGGGKTWLIRDQFIPINSRNFILPASGFDNSFDSVGRRLKPAAHYIQEAQKRVQIGKKKTRYAVKKWYMPGLNTFAGNVICDIGTIEDDKDYYEFFRSISTNRGGIVAAGLVIDDMKNYILATGKLPGTIREMFSERRKRELDIFMATHSFQDVNADLIQYKPSFFIFNTELPPYGAVLDKIRLSKELLQTIEYINWVAQNKDAHYFEPFHPTNTTLNIKPEQREYWDEFSNK
ncbi:MAG: hypothetical protein ABL951_04250 [Alphaproteobacteria bacterium]